MTGSHISLFSGVGMTDLAVERFGYRTVATAEIDPWCRQLLAKRYPSAVHYEDVADVKNGPGTPWINPTVPGGCFENFQRPLLISGGFPCQGVSSAGSGEGLKDPRSGLWRQFARVIQEFQPDKVLIENTPMLRTRGLDRVLCDLSDLGYDARWDCIPAASVGAPHIRDRIFIVAWPATKDIDYTDLEGSYLGMAITAGVASTAWLNHCGGLGEPEKYVKRFPRAGELRSGFVSGRTPLAPIKAAKAACLAHPNACPATPTGAWPTPAASMPQDYEKPDTWLERRAVLKAKGINGNGAGMPLSIAVRLFPTPTRADGTGGPGTSPHRKGGKNLRTVVAEESGSGRLNPMWIEWLMGLPLGWTDPAVDNDDLVCHPGWAAEPVPRTAQVQKHRKERLTALGNGLVPQAAEAALTLLNED